MKVVKTCGLPLIHTQVTQIIRPSTKEEALEKEEHMNLYLQKPEPGHITMTSTRLGELRLS